MCRGRYSMCLREALPRCLALPPCPLPRAESLRAPPAACACPSCVQARKGSARSPILDGHDGVSRSPPRVAAPLPSPVPANSRRAAVRYACVCRRCGRGDWARSGMHGLKPCPALAAAISELSTAIAFALSTVSSSTVRALGGSGWVTQSPSLRYTFMRRMGRYKDFLPVYS